MKFLIVGALLVAFTSAAPQFQQQRQQRRPEADATILRLASDNSPEGSFTYSFETSNGIQADARGDLKNGGPDGPIQVVQGQFSYTDDTGSPVAISYVADENGYQPQGAVLPTPPPTPEAILRALEFIARNPQPQYQQQ